MAMHRYVLLRQRRTLTKTITRDTRLNSTTGTRDSGRNSDLNQNTNCLGDTVYPTRDAEAWGSTGGEARGRSEEHTSELQSLMRISYAVFCLKKKNNRKQQTRANKNSK